ncbi:MAG: hypothetical protein Q4P14_00845, partial [Methanobacteriaceae archaeon]|nr:hypothetical protein [Methanobacteriaceae archaeon]
QKSDVKLTVTIDDGNSVSVGVNNLDEIEKHDIDIRKDLYETTTQGNGSTSDNSTGVDEDNATSDDVSSVPIVDNMEDTGNPLFILVIALACIGIGALKGKF